MHELRWNWDGGDGCGESLSHAMWSGASWRRGQLRSDPLRRKD
jgi:hypothetical protein